MEKKEKRGWLVQVGVVSRFILSKVGLFNRREGAQQDKGPGGRERFRYYFTARSKSIFNS